MCGIAGFFIAPADIDKINTELMTFSLAADMQSRGRDATGMATVDRRGRWRVRKEPNKAEIFLARKEGIGKSATTALIHTRAATQGSVNDPKNNHPVIVGNHIGIHNGIVWNDDALYRHYDWKRQGKVDSEVIFAALDNLPYTEAITQIAGSWAVAWLNVGFDPNQLWLARGESSPLCYALTENGSIIFASTLSAVKEAFKWGGIKGDPDVQTAPEGFLAHSNTEGGLTICEKFDGSGKAAPGYKPRTFNNYTSGSHAGKRWGANGWEEYYPERGAHDYDGEGWYVGPTGNLTPRSSIGGQSTTPLIGPDGKVLPMKHVRQWIKGDKKNHLKDDIRKYIDDRNYWVYERCIKGADDGGCSTWQIVGERSVYAKEDAPMRCYVDGKVQGELPSGKADGVAQVTITADQARIETAELIEQIFSDNVDEDDDGEVVLPFDQDSLTETETDDHSPAADLRYGFAAEGDIIGIRRDTFDPKAHADAMLIGIVTDREGVDLTVKFNTSAHIDIYSEYEVLSRASHVGA